jgi:hypothetical protein
VSRHPSLPPNPVGPRFPGFDVMDQSPHWDEETRAAVVTRLHALPGVRFFTPVEEAAAKCLFDQLLDQRAEPGEPVIDIVRMVDSRLAEEETDGWHYDTMPTDGEAWRRSLAALDDDARQAHGRPFADCDWGQQQGLLREIQSDESQDWHGMPRTAVWSLWTRYAATAFYSHPWAWNEIGFSGPAYPRGYKAAGVGKREPYEVPDAMPGDNPSPEDPE